MTPTPSQIVAASETARKLAKMETKHGPADADEVEHYENCECCGNFHRMEQERDGMAKELQDKSHSDALLVEQVGMLEEHIETLQSENAAMRGALEPILSYPEIQKFIGNILFTAAQKSIKGDENV